jgi:hypothetical protein
MILQNIITFICNFFCHPTISILQGDSRVIMNPRKLKMQTTIYLERKAGYGRGKYPALPSKCIVGCIFNSIGLIITQQQSSCWKESLKILWLHYERSKRQSHQFCTHKTCWYISISSNRYHCVYVFV